MLYFIKISSKQKKKHVQVLHFLVNPPILCFFHANQICREKYLWYFQKYFIVMKDLQELTFPYLSLLSSQIPILRNMLFLQALHGCNRYWIVMKVMFTSFSCLCFVFLVKEIHCIKIAGIVFFSQSNTEDL